jgi:hypothetical protein
MKSVIYFFSILFLLAVTTSCKKTDMVTPPDLAEFLTTKSTDTYYIENTPASAYKIPIGVTTVSDKDRQVNFTVTSLTGATAGNQYTLSSTGSITIPAGKAVDTLTVRGLFSGYSATRKDTLVFHITGGDFEGASELSDFKLVLRPFCPVDLSIFTGTYRIQDYQADGTPDGGSYTATLSGAISTGTNKGTVMVSGLWGVASPTVKVELDWTEKTNFTTYIPTANWFVSSTYGQSTINPDDKGTFSSCENSLLIRYEPKVAAGSYGKYYSVLTK